MAEVGLKERRSRGCGRYGPEAVGHSMHALLARPKVKSESSLHTAVRDL
jgi:hypothetical protein